MSGLRYKLLFYTLFTSLVITVPLALILQYANSEINAYYRLTGIYIISLLAIAISGIYALNRLVLKPVHILQNATMRLSTGQYDIEIPVRQHDEIGELAEVFRKLQANLNSTMQRQGNETEALNDILVELKASENRAKGIFRSVQDGLVLTDALGMIEAVNPGMCNMTGYEEHELLGHSVDILIPETYRPKHQQKIVDFVLDKKRPTRDYMQLEARHKHNSNVPVEVSISRISSEGEHKLLAVIHDVTERLMAERELRKERDRAQSYLDTAEVAIITIDTGCNITLVNRKCRELLGYSEAELIGMDYFSLCPNKDVAEELREAYLLHITEDETFPKFFYIDLQTKGGEKRIFEWHNNTVKDYEWNTTGIILAGTDMTEFRKSVDDRKALRDRLYQSQKMQAIGQLSSGIAHDFNNLLATMMGYTELLQEMLADNDDESIPSYLHEIYDSGERARDLIDSMLKYSRGAKSDDAEYVEKLYFPGLAKEIENMLHGVLPKNVKLSMQLRQDTHLVKMDSLKLQQIIINLGLNAAEAMREGGELVINAQNRDHYQGNCDSCAKSFSGDYLELSITDTGSGIDSDTISHLFEPFYTTKIVGEVGQGAGMGLAVVHGLVHDANGHITVESKPGVGTTINILLPAATQQSVAVSAHG